MNEYDRGYLNGFNDAEEEYIGRSVFKGYDLRESISNSSLYDIAKKLTSEEYECLVAICNEYENLNKGV